MTKFNVGDEIKVTQNTSCIRDKETAGWHVRGQGVVKIGSIGIVESVVGNLIKAKFKKEDVDDGAINFSRKLRFDEIELVETKPTKNQRITALENEVAELKLIVHELRGKKSIESSAILEDIIEFEGQQYRKVDREAKVGDVVIFNSKIYPHNAEPNKPYIVNREIAYGVGHHDGETVCNVKFAIYDHGRTPENVAVYELIEPKPLTPNQHRAAVIEKAMQFVEENKSKIHPGNNKRTTIRLVGNITDVLEFVVNVEKRTVVALIKGVSSGDLYAKGIAKCNPNDVFNEHIGKAIALGRALGLDVSEFEQAVQPTEFTKGQIVVGGSTYREPREVTKVTHDDYVYRKPIGGNDFDDSWCNAKYLTIINDTNATYEVSSNE